MLRVTPLRGGSGLRRGASRINPVSKKRRSEETQYRKLRAAFLAGHPFCEFPDGCGVPATEIQHRRGRRGARLVDVDWWAASCHSHNMWAEDHTGEALRIGWLVRIEGAA